MTFTKSILLGSGAVLMAAATAQAADLPSRKAAPVEYVRVCDAYGAGFFFIPGTQTCLRIGGRVRADYAFVPAKTIFSGATQAAAGGPVTRTIASHEDAQHAVGWEARGRINVDARTQTSWGTVQTAFQLRMTRDKGVLTSNDGAQGLGHGTGPVLESAFIRFAGFTFGAARDNFAFMPSLTYGAGHWASFGNGAKQLAYTHTFGGGLSVTVALQDHLDTTNSSQSAATFTGLNSASAAATGTLAPYYVHNSIPQINGRLDWAQGWGEISIAGAYASVNANNVAVAAGTTATTPAIAADTFDASKGVWAIGAGVRINLPMLASGSALWLHAAYADGMSEYAANYTSVKTTAFRRDVGGFAMAAHPSYVYEGAGTAGNAYRIETVKSWNVAALLQHFWAPQYRSIAWVSYGSFDAPAAASARVWNGTTGFGDATAWNVGKQFAWLPTRDFEIGVEVIYSRVNQDVRTGTGTPVAPNALVIKDSQSNFTGRLRVERNF